MDLNFGVFSCDNRYTLIVCFKLFHSLGSLEGQDKNILLDLSKLLMNNLEHPSICFCYSAPSVLCELKHFYLHFTSLPNWDPKQLFTLEFYIHWSWMEFHAT